jgi:hypothetical protein
VSIEWDPPEARPADGEEVEGLIDSVARGAQVKVRVRPEGWRVRALGGAAMCERGAGLAGRDLSQRVADLLEEAGYPVFRAPTGR